MGSRHGSVTSAFALACALGCTFQPVELASRNCADSACPGGVSRTADPLDGGSAGDDRGTTDVGDTAGAIEGDGVVTGDGGGMGDPTAPGDSLGGDFVLGDATLPGDPISFGDETTGDSVLSGDPVSGGDATLCGNGQIDSGETCDGSCPTTCIASNCFSWSLVGTPETCDVECYYYELLVCLDGDGCCPSTCSQANDSDCGGGGGTCPGSCARNNDCRNCGGGTTCNTYGGKACCSVCSGPTCGCVL